MNKLVNRFDTYNDALVISAIFIVLFILFGSSFNLIPYEYIPSIFLFLNIYFIIRVIYYFFSEHISFIRLLLTLLVGVTSTAYMIYEFRDISLVLERTQIYIIVLLIIAEVIASSIVANIRMSVYKRSSDDKSKAYLPKVPLALQAKINFLAINSVLFLLTIVIAIFSFDEPLKSFWYIVFIFPFMIHILSLIPYFLFRNSSMIEINQKMFEEEDKNFLLDSIGKKLANKASKSCRKTTSKEYDIVKHCLENGLDSNEIFEDRYTLLLPSTCCGDEKLVRLLIKHGANVNFRSKLGMTPIYLASQHGAYSLVQLLIENGVNIDIASTDEVKSPLLESTIQGHDLIVSALIKAGGDVNIKDVEGKTALDYAREKGFENIIKILNTKY